MTDLSERQIRVLLYLAANPASHELRELDQLMPDLLVASSAAVALINHKYLSVMPIHDRRVMVNINPAGKVIAEELRLEIDRAKSFYRGDLWIGSAEEAKANTITRYGAAIAAIALTELW